MKGFFAYSANPPQIAETIRSAIKDVEHFHAVTNIVDWAELDIPGRFMSLEILRKIDKSDFLVADITTLNFNVTFEVGYAIGRQKRIVVVRNEAYGKSEDEKIRRLGIFDTLGYRNYQNYRDLAAIVKTVRDIDSLLREISIDRTQPIYVTKTRYQSDYAIRISARLKKSGLSYRSFDPTEQPRLSALDAISQVVRSVGVLVHLIPAAIDDSEIHNLRGAFIAGLATGLGKELTIVQEGYDPVPIDYRDFVKTATHPSQIDEAVADLAGGVVAKLSEASESAGQVFSSVLEKVHFGASSAENEISDLADYYLSTDEFRRALHGEVRLVVGRKGAGKSAVFFRIRDKVSSGRRNVVLDLKPDGYQLVKFKDRVLKAMDRGTQEHTIVAFWQCVLLLEITRAALQLDKHTYRTDDSIYSTYLQLDEKYKEYGYESGQGDFAERITNLIYRIESRFNASQVDGVLVTLSTPEVTKLIYDVDVSKLSEALISHLNKKEALWVLFDNIDKGWTPTGIDASDILTLRALLDATRKLQRSLTSEDFDVRILIFLRNDVYELLIDQTADRGKEQKVLVDWRDPDALKELVRLRISSTLGDAETPLDELWARIAVRHVNGEDSYQFIVDRCLMRPRYLIDLLKYSRGCALTLRHEKITDDDIKKAVSFFSTDIVQDTNLEFRDIFPEYDGILYAFIGSKCFLSLDDVRLCLMLFKVDETHIPNVIKLLLWYAFLGVRDEHYENQYIYSKGYNIKSFEAYVNSRLSQGAALVINPAFWDGLALELA